MTELSIVIPMYNESDMVRQLFTRLLPVLQSITPDWEILCINDGSTDDTLSQLVDWNSQNPRIRYLSLSRNFGKEAALTAGLNHAQGRAVIPLDADLQDPPELIPQMVEAWRNGFKVVLACRRNRAEDHWLKSLSAHLFYRLFGRLSNVPVPIDAGDFRLMDRQVIEVLRHLPERTRFMKGLFAWVGFSTTSIYFDRAPRSSGQPSQTAQKLWSLAKDGIFSFTTVPLKLTTYLGAVVSSFAFAYAIFLLIRTVVQGVDVPGYASIMAAVLGLGGVQLLCLGILGEYIGRIYRETKQRPLYIIESQSSPT